MAGKRLLLILVLLPLAVFAQKIEGGLLLGINATQVAGDRLSGFNKAGIMAGGYASVRFGFKSEFRMELEYSQKGSRENPTDENPFQYLLRVNYVELPMLYRYHYNQRLIFEVGLSYGYLLHYYEENNYSTEVSSTGFHTHALNLVAGIAYVLNPRINAGFRTSNSILTIREHPYNVHRFFNEGQFNDALTLYLSYKLGKDE